VKASARLKKQAQAMAKDDPIGAAEYVILAELNAHSERVRDAIDQSHRLASMNIRGEIYRLRALVRIK